MGLPWEDDDDNGGWSPAKVAGAAAGVMTGGGVAAGVAGSQMAPGVQEQASKAVGMDHTKEKQLAEDSARAASESSDRKATILQGMSGRDDAYKGTYKGINEGYLGAMSGAKDAYMNDLKNVQEQSRKAGADARQVYSNDIQPRLKSSMEGAQKEAAGAMTLAEAGDVNNKTHQAVEGKYNDLAGGVQKQGLADYGVLSALGAQATGNAMGAAGAPLTGSQTQLMGANNQRQASQAYNIAAKRMNDLKQQGIDKGFSESDKQYDRGQGAQDRYRQSIGDVEDGMNRDLGRQYESQDRDLGYSSDRLGTQGAYEGLARGTRMDTLNTEHGIDTGGANRQIGLENERSGNTQAGIANASAMAAAENAQKAGMFGSVLGAAGTIGGAMAGGPLGAAAGGAAGNGIGAGMGGYQAPPSNQRRAYRYQPEAVA